MKKIAMLALAAAATVAAVPGSAQAHSGAASAKGHARYVWLKACDKNEYTVPCGKWTVSLTNGKKVVLSDAILHPQLANGRTDREASTKITLSPDGRLASYFRKSDRRLVIRDLTTGKIRTLPGKWGATPKGLGMSDLDTYLASDGALLIDYSDSGNKRPTVIISPDGTIQKLPGDAVAYGFTPDSGHVLLSRYTDENTTEYLSYDRNGTKTAGQVVPQVVTSNGPSALADDGSSIAVPITTTSGRQRLRVYDLAADSLSGAVSVKMPKAEQIQQVQWESDDKLTLWGMIYDKKGNAKRSIVRIVDTTSGTTSVLDSYAVESKLWSWWLPGS